MVDGYITKIQKFSVHDGPGIRTTVFLKGCPLECMWCQNPETIRARPEVTFDVNRCVKCEKCIQVCPQGCFSQEREDPEHVVLHFDSRTCDQCGLCVTACPVDALRWTAEKWAADAVIEKVMDDREYYEASGGGLTLSGGEPLQQIAFAADLAQRAKSRRLHVTIDTAAYVPFASFEKILPYADLFLYDLKFIDDTLHKKYIGKSNRLILDNFRRVCETTKEVIVRIPMIPEVNDFDENLKAIEAFARECRANIEINQIPWNAFMPEKYQMIGQKAFTERKKEQDFPFYTLALPQAFNRI